MGAVLQVQQLCTQLTRVRDHAARLQAEARQAGRDWASGTAQETLQRLPVSPAPVAAPAAGSPQADATCYQLLDEPAAATDAELADFDVLSTLRTSMQLDEHSSHASRSGGGGTTLQMTAQQADKEDEDRSLLELVRTSARFAGATSDGSAGSELLSQADLAALPVAAADTPGVRDTLSLTDKPLSSAADAPCHAASTAAGADAADAADFRSPAPSEHYTSSRVSSGGSHGSSGAAPAARLAKADTSEPVAEGMSNSYGRCSSLDLAEWPPARNLSPPALHRSEHASSPRRLDAHVGIAGAGASGTSEHLLAELADLIISVCEEDAAGRANARSKQPATVKQILSPVSTQRQSRAAELRLSHGAAQQRRRAPLEPRTAERVASGAAEVVSRDLDAALRAALDASMATIGLPAAQLRARLQQQSAQPAEPYQEGQADVDAGRAFLSMADMSQSGSASPAQTCAMPVRSVDAPDPRTTARDAAAASAHRECDCPARAILVRSQASSVAAERRKAGALCADSDEGLSVSPPLPGGSVSGTSALGSAHGERADASARACALHADAHCAAAVSEAANSDSKLDQARAPAPRRAQQQQAPVEVQLPASLAWRLGIRGTIEDEEGRRISVLPARHSKSSRRGNKVRAARAAPQPKGCARGAASKRSTAARQTVTESRLDGSGAAVALTSAQSGSAQECENVFGRSQQGNLSLQGSISSSARSERRRAKLRQLCALADARRRPSQCHDAVPDAAREEVGARPGVAVQSGALWLHAHARELAANRDARTAQRLQGLLQDMTNLDKCDLVQ